ncbi:DNA-protecting protein DprA [bacterium]|nr:DNA-protecting protein DprA [bacterium]
MDFQHLESWLRFQQTEGIGRVYSQRLLDLYGEPSNFMGQDLDLPDLPRKVLDQIRDNKRVNNFEQVCKLIENYEIKYLTCLDKDYPQGLRNIFSPPLMLFYRGQLPQDAWNNTLAIVGTRRADNYGKYITEKISRELSAKGVIIVSGLAYGVDTIAHKACLASGGKTLAVMATGCDQIYPPENRRLAEKIIENGAICSEYVPGVVAERYFFPQRNRIISALSMGTLVVQGKKSSGAMLTAKYAIDQNKELFAIPGQINNPLSEGPNYLIKNGAWMVTESEDILSSFINTNYVEQLTIFPELSNEEKVVYNYIKQENRPVYYDEIIINTKIQMSKLSSLLMNLELKGVIQAQGGNKYIYLY